jgi:oligopeptide transport system substrate-binding protein
VNGGLNALLATCFTVLAACGLDGGASAVTVGGASGMELAEVQVLHRGNGADPQSLDPHKAEGVPEQNILRDLFEGLTSESSQGDVIPGAAEAWRISDDGITYVFELRRDARWSNGDTVTAGDFVHSFRRTLDPATGSRYAFVLSPIRNAAAVLAGRVPPHEVGVRALGDHALEIVLENPTPYFLGLVAHPASYPIHRASVAAHGERHARPGNLVSNGPYRLAEWVVQSHVRLERNPHYWDDAGTTIDDVWYLTTEDTAAELKRYRAGELDLTEFVPKAQLPWIRRNLGDELVIAPYLGTYYYGFNVTRPPFQGNRELRRALALAVDREILTAQVLAAGEIPAYGWVPAIADYQGQPMPEAQWSQAQREQEAKRLYAAAGYSADEPLQIELLYNTQDDHRRIAVAVAAMWRQVLGVETTIVNQEWKAYLETRSQRRDTQVFRASWVGDYNDAFTFAELFRSAGGLNATGYASPEYDRMLDLTAAEAYAARRVGHLQQAERVLLDDMPLIPLYFYVTARMVKPWIGGYESNIMDHHRTKDLYILKH